MSDVFLGFDTSNYTTSVALCDGDGSILANIKEPLPVKTGEVGLRQSDAVFSHIKNLPRAAERLRTVLADTTLRIAGVACSVSPRSASGSYMPCFLAGRAAAAGAAAVLGVPLYETSHQVGHVIAATLSANDGRIPLSHMFDSEYIALHVSGGTTDILHVVPSQDAIIDISRIGGSEDANAGQIIDRIGVKLGFKFPCGPELDRAALGLSDTPRVSRVSVKGADFNLSGLQNLAERMISDGFGQSDVSAFVLEYIARSLRSAVSAARGMFGDMPVIFAGGVMSSEYIRRRLSDLGSFAEPPLSADNAVGVAAAGALLHQRSVVGREV